MQNNTRSENERTSDSFACKKRREVNGKIFAARRTDAGKKSKRSARSAERCANSLAAVMVELRGFVRSKATE